jgi:hypothetical protein
MAEPKNIFSIGRTPADEDQLTELLVWLSSAVAEVRAAVIEMAMPGIELDLSQIQASTQHGIAGGRLDALFVSESVALVVESKLGSSYGEGQLRKYLDWLAEAHEKSAHRALMTLTEREEPWPAQDEAHATSLGVTAAPRRWQDLFTALKEVAGKIEPDGLSARLVQEFLDMLNDEGLIPMKPLEVDELGDEWSRSQVIVRRYHDYFRACREAIAEALEATPHSNRSSAQATYIYQDFETAEGELIAVGLNYTDREFPLTPKVYRDAPVVMLMIEAHDWPDWESAITRLEKKPPAGWRVNPKRWYGRPQVWRYLDEVVGAGTFDEQRSCLASSCGQASDWLASARPADYRAKAAAAGDADQTQAPR